MLGPPKDINHINRRVDRGQIGHDRFAKKLLACVAGVHRDHPIALQRKIARHEVAGARFVHGNADTGDDLCFVEDLAEEIVRIRHAFALPEKKRPGHTARAPVTERGTVK